MHAPPSPVHPLASKSDTVGRGGKAAIHLGQPPGWGVNWWTKLAKRQFSGTVPFSGGVFPKPWDFLSFFSFLLRCFVIPRQN